MPTFDTLWWHRNWLAVVLWVLFGLSSFLMLKSSSGSNQIIFDTTAGINVSLFIYVLVVWLPERGKRTRVRRNLQLQFDTFKEECIRILLSALGGGYDPDLVDRLKDRVEFRQFFKEASSTAGQTRWDAVLNGLDEYHIKLLAIEFEILVSEIRFTLTAIDVDNPGAFTLLKRLAHTLHRTKHLSPDYDDVKQLSGFLWSVFTGWSFVEGYTEKDVIAQMIESI